MSKITDIKCSVFIKCSTFCFYLTNETSEKFNFADLQKVKYLTICVVVDENSLGSHQNSDISETSGDGSSTVMPPDTVLPVDDEELAQLLVDMVSNHD